MLRRTFYVASALVVVAALLLVPVPLLVLEPGGALEVVDPDSPIIEVGGVPTTELSGDYLLTTVRVGTQPAAGVVQAWLDDAEQVVTARSVIPSGIDPAEYRDIQREVFRESIRAAGAVGARTAGLDVEISGGGARIAHVLPGVPAADVLRQGDVIVGVAGREVGLASEVVAAIEGRDAGDTIAVTLRRGEETVEETVRLTRLPDSDRAGLGVLVSTVDLTIDMPVTVEPAEGVRIGGPSAGLMFSLSVYDLLADEDLLAGRRVAGTGTIDLSGVVGPISGIAAKVETAVEAGAEVFLAPAAQAAAARAASAGRIDVVGVTSLDEAIAALRDG